MYIGDGIEGTLFASVTITNKGVGNTEAKAYGMAFKGIKPTSDEIQSFIEEGKQKRYYNSQCDFILAEAQTLGKTSNMTTPSRKCMSIPEVCKDCYMKAMEKAETIFMDKINLECQAQLNEARATWSASQTPEGAEATSAILSTINPQSACFKESKNFMNLIFTEIKNEEIDRREWEMKVKQQEDATRLESERISAMKEIERLTLRPQKWCTESFIGHNRLSCFESLDFSASWGWPQSLGDRFPFRIVTLAFE